MSRWYFLLISVLFFVSGCHRFSTEPHLPTLKPILHRQLPSFTHVYVQGLMNVNLHTGYAKPQVTFHGDPRDLAHVNTSVVNGDLRIILGKGYPRYGAVSVDIKGQYWTIFEYHGSGNVTGNNLWANVLQVILDNAQGQTRLNGRLGLRSLDVKGNGYTEIRGVNSPYLRVKLSGHPKVRIVGAVNLSSLDVSEGAGLSLFWVKSRSLTINAHGKGFIQLAGMVDKLYVELWDKARFRGRYLRAQRAFVKTHGQSVAEVSAVKRQHTLASDNSDVQFFNIPVMKADFMGDNGAVLDMRWLGAPFLEEYNQYNK